MPTDDFDPADFLPNDWKESEVFLFDKALGDFDAFEDRWAQNLFDNAYFNFDLTTDQINDFRERLDDYLMDEYGIDFDAVFDWEAYREAYGSQ